MRKISKEELIQDLQETAEKIDGNVTVDKYRKKGTYSCTPFYERFGSWTEACEQARVNNGSRGRNPIYTLDELRKYAEQLVADDRVDTPFVLGIPPELPEEYPHVKTIVRRMDVTELRNIGFIVSMDDQVTAFLEHIKEKGPGWYTNEEMRDCIPGLNQSAVKNILEEVNRRENPVSVSFNGTSGGNGIRYYIEIEGFDRYEYLKERLCSDFVAVFEEAVGYGRSPSALAAALYYMQEDGVTQREAADLYDVTPCSVCNCRDFVVEEFDVGEA